LVQTPDQSLAIPHRQPDFLEAWWVIYVDLADFDAGLAKYTASPERVRRAARLLLQREIERRRPGKADTVRSVALATLAPLILVGVGLWSDWSAALFSVLAESQVPTASVNELSSLFAQALGPTLWAFVLVVLALILLLYVWAIATWGVDKKRGAYVAWLNAYLEYEATLGARPVTGVPGPMGICRILQRLLDRA
jgi:hypothetical protein